jgi:hypothetical protein
VNARIQGGNSLQFIIRNRLDDKYVHCFHEGLSASFNSFGTFVSSMPSSRPSSS